MLIESIFRFVSSFNKYLVKLNDKYCVKLHATKLYATNRENIACLEVLSICSAQLTMKENNSVTKYVQKINTRKCNYSVGIMPLNVLFRQYFIVYFYKVIQALKFN